MTEKEIWDKAYNRIFELYGDMPDLRLVSRFYILTWYQAYYPNKHRRIMAEYSH